MTVDRDMVARKLLGYLRHEIALADVRAFGLLWEDCERMLRQLGYSVRLERFARPDFA